jgi:hypothetical protein
MSKWEYMYVESFTHRIIKIDNKMLADTKYKDSAHRIDAYNLELAASEFLTEVGRKGWEVAGMCDASEDGKSWRMILKRSIPE